MNRASSTRKDGESPREERILRFRRSERRVHWALAIPFLLCYTSALILVVYYNPDPHRPYRDIVSWFHRLSGVSLILMPLWAVYAARGDIRVHFANIRQAWIWSLQDFRWLALMGLAALSPRVRLPEQGKFNAAEKLNFMVLMSTYPLYILTGAAIWFTHGAILAWVIHVGMAILATPLVGGHIFMATLNPNTRKGLQGMISGFVDRQWAKHHYRRWYRENFEHLPVAARPPFGAPAPASGPIQSMSGNASPVDDAQPIASAPLVVEAPAPTASAICDVCGFESAIASPELLLQTIVGSEPLRCSLCQAEVHRISTTIEPKVFQSLLLSLQRRSSPELLQVERPEVGSSL